MTMPLAKVLPQLSYAETWLVGVVEQNDSTARQFGSPLFKVIPHSFVKMAAIDMKQINRTVRKLLIRIVKRRTDQSRESCVAAVIPAQLFVHVFTVSAGMLIAFPRVDSVATGS